MIAIDFAHGVRHTARQGVRYTRHVRPKAKRMRGFVGSTQVCFFAHGVTSIHMDRAIGVWVHRRSGHSFGVGAAHGLRRPSCEGVLRFRGMGRWFSQIGVGDEVVHSTLSAGSVRRYGSMGRRLPEGSCQVVK